MPTPSLNISVDAACVLYLWKLHTFREYNVSKIEELADLLTEHPTLGLKPPENVSIHETVMWPKDPAFEGSKKLGLMVLAGAFAMDFVITVSIISNLVKFLVPCLRFCWQPTQFPTEPPSNRSK
ncbi:unnamed protein product [Dibothriocephalus latus]|uniref:Uncharacterized protein n=1 Tax=Dibothriocephalus latus TaxID=60516 RepID=A0A3P7LK51_DIBLA|nr:unnamed protein product [Dibothriocephalus latus]